MVKDRFGSKVRIGLFGGTFDPIHCGHLRAAEEAREAFALQKVLFIPAARPPHKDLESVSSADHRLEMVRKAIAGHPSFEVSDLECGRSGASYWVETLRVLQEGGCTAGGLYSLLGLDAFLEIDTWREYPKLFELSNWVVFQRPGAGPLGRGALPMTLRGIFRYDRAGKGYVHPSGRRVYFQRFRCLEISGREIREKVRSGRSICYLLPRSVEAYVRHQRLYDTRLKASQRDDAP